MRRVLIDAGKLLLLGLFAGTIMLSLLALAWQARGGHILNVQTGSMVPTFKPGDAVVSEKVKPNALHAGDIVSYRSPQNPKVSITHRLISVDYTSGRLITQGDKLDVADPPVPISAVIGRVKWFMPGTGSVLGLVATPIGLVFLIYVPALGIIIYEIKHFYSNHSRKLYQLIL